MAGGHPTEPVVVKLESWGSDAVLSLLGASSTCQCIANLSANNPEDMQFKVEYRHRELSVRCTQYDSGKQVLLQPYQGVSCMPSPTSAAWGPSCSKSPSANAENALPKCILGLSSLCAALANGCSSAAASACAACCTTRSQAGHAIVMPQRLTQTRLRAPKVWPPGPATGANSCHREYLVRKRMSIEIRIGL